MSQSNNPTADIAEDCTSEHGIVLTDSSQLSPLEENSHHIDSNGSVECRDDSQEDSTELSPLNKADGSVGEACGVVTIETTIEEDLKRAPDGGWGWLIVLGALLVHVLMGGFERGNGVNYLEMKERFGGSATSTSWIFSIFSTLRLLLGPVVSALSNRFSCRSVGLVGGLLSSLSLLLSGFAPGIPYLYFTYGVLGGVGRSLIYTTGLIMVGMYFNKRRGLAVGLATSGVGLGTFIIPPLIELLYSSYGFQGALLILSGINCHFLVAASLFLPLSKYREIRKRQLLSKAKKEHPGVAVSLNTAETSETTKSLLRIQTATDISTSMEIIAKSKVESRRPTLFARKFSQLKLSMKGSGKKAQPLFEISLLKNLTFLALCIGIMLFTMSYNSSFVYLPALAKSKGLTTLESAFVVSIIGIVDGVTRIVFSVILDLKRVKPFRLLIYNLVMLLVAIVCVLIPSMQTFVQFAGIGAAYGLLTGIYISQKSVVIVDILGVEKFSSSFGMLLLFQGIGALIGPTIGGILRDALGSYDGSFYVGAGGILVGALIVLAGNIKKIVTDRDLKKKDRHDGSAS